MLGKGTHACANRIVSIFQPHIRPIVRGKAKVEFGAKIGVSIYNGYSFVDHHSWDAYNEISDSEIHTRLFGKPMRLRPTASLSAGLPKSPGNPNITTTWHRPSETETKSNVPSVPARESTEPTTYEPSFPILQNAGQKCATLPKT